MASINEFIEQRWADAKEELRKIDGNFVQRSESEIQLQSLGLETPWVVDVDRPPSGQLPAKWHRLLEACLELSLQTWNVRVAANSLTSEANARLSDYEAGIRVDYHFRSLFIYVKALAERTGDVIGKTTEVYVTDSAKRREIAGRHQESVNRRIGERVRRQRNDYLHARRSWSSGVTEDELWEKLVAGGMTPEKFLAEFHYPGQGADAKQGKYDVYPGDTASILDGVGLILQELEADLKASD